MRIAFCDDQKSIIETLEELVQKFNNQNQFQDTLFSFTSPVNLYSFMQKEKIDLIFMDLEFTDISEDGIEWSKKILKMRRTFPK